MSEVDSESLAVAYVRMSTEHQQYSTNNQMDVIRQYAARRGLTILREYSDEGKSGLKIQGRQSLGQMINLVQDGKADFRHILVYDVSRWGRFQDADESAFYEFICRRSGISVHYCAEQFENDGSPVSTIVKSVKRAMAGEYSRELSTKVFQGACRLIQLGFKQGGTAGYGLRRMLVDQNGDQKGILRMGEHKSLQTDRVILVPGPAEEVENVRWMYSTFINEGRTELEIADALNLRNISTDLDRKWTRSSVHEVLTNEKYIGNNVYHRTSFKLKRKHVKNPPEMWIRTEGAFEGLVDPEVFYTAQGIILARSRRLSDEDMLSRLKDVLSRYGRLSGIIINEERDMPSACAYRHRFGSLLKAYQLVGYEPMIDYAFIEENRRLRAMHPGIISKIVADLEAVGNLVEIDEDSQLLRLNNELSVSLALCRHTINSSGNSRWLIRLDESLKPDITIAVRMNEDNESIYDYYLLPSIEITQAKLKVAEDNGIYLDVFRYETLDEFLNFTARCVIKEAA